MDKIRKAVALKYDQEKDHAPKVIAKGRGEIAEKIIEIAGAHNLPLYEDKNLVQILEALDLETEIPPELYRAVAEVLAFIYRLNGKIWPLIFISILFQFTGIWFQVSAQPLAWKAASLIEKETDERRTSNVEWFYSICLKRFSEAIPAFDIRYSLFCGSLFTPAVKATRLLIN